MYEKETNNIIGKLEDLEKGGYDSRNFLKWQADVKSQDLEEMLKKIEKHRLNGKLSFEEAILARDRLIDENKKRAIAVKKEKQNLMEKHAKVLLTEKEKIKTTVKKIAGDRESFKIIQKDLLMQKRNIAKEVGKESEELVRNALENVNIIINLSNM